MRGLPEPAFVTSTGRFTVTFLQDSYTEERLRALGLSDRQVIAVRTAQAEGSVDNAALRAQTGVSKRTASRDLSELEKSGLLRRIGETGKGTRYELIGAGTADRDARQANGDKGAINGP